MYDDWDRERTYQQKITVGFVAGLLIGGLLVWVFSIAPADQCEAQITPTVIRN